MGNIRASKKKRGWTQYEEYCMYTWYLSSNQLISEFSKWYAVKSERSIRSVDQRLRIVERIYNKEVSYVISKSNL